MPVSLFSGKSNDDSLKNGLKDLATILRFVPRQGALQMRARSSMVVWLLISEMRRSLKWCTS